MTKFDAAFFDVDQTLYDGNTGEVAPSAIEAIQKSQANGLKVFVATGRCYNAFVLSGLNKIIAWDGYVTNNGASIQNKDGEPLNTIHFSKEQIEKLIQFCKENEMGLCLQDSQKIFEVLNPNHRVDDAFVFFHAPVPVHKEYEGEDICMATVYQSMDYDYSRIEAIEGLVSIPGKAPYADITLKGVSKANGLQMVKDVYSFTKPVIAFGDGNNDLEMIQYADLGICMGNGTSELKENADYVTDDIDKDGIYKALKHFGCF